MVVASNVGIVPSGKWGLERCQIKWRYEATLYLLWEQLSVGDRDRDKVPLCRVLVSLLSARFTL